MNQTQKTPWRFVLLLFLCALVLTACANGEDPEPEIPVLIYAQLSEDGIDREAVDRFNQAHEDVQIEVRNYFELSENGRQGVDLLLTEIAAGHTPDIIELGSDGQTCHLPYRRMAEKGYLEDLWPYIENDPDLGRDGVVEAPLKSAEVNGGLYTVFDSVWLHTLTGAEEVVGDRTSWTLEDLMESFASMSEEAALMDDDEPGGWEAVPDMKDYLLTCLMSCFVDSFVDTETGRCSFDSQQFRTVLEFINQSSDRYEWRDECKTEDEVLEALVLRKRKGLTMLEQKGFFRLYHMASFNFCFGGCAALVGYPTEDGSIGAYFEPMGVKLAMSSTCQNKETAWQYVRQTLLPKRGSGAYPEERYDGIPVNQKMYNRQLKRCEEASFVYVGNDTFIDIDPMSKQECRRLDEYFNSVTRCSLFLETDLLNIVREGAAPYFAGDIPLDEAVDRIQNRAALYVNEQM